MTKPKISLDTFTAALLKYRDSRKTNRREPGMNGAGCTYVVRGDEDKILGHCSIGQVMFDLGVEVPDKCEGSDASYVVDCLEDLFIVKDREAISDLALAVQRLADKGQPWGKAIRATRKDLTRWADENVADDTDRKIVDAIRRNW